MPGCLLIPSGHQCKHNVWNHFCLCVCVCVCVFLTVLVEVEHDCGNNRELKNLINYYKKADSGKFPPKSSIFNL